MTWKKIVCADNINLGEMAVFDQVQLCTIVDPYLGLLSHAAHFCQVEEP